MRRYNLSWKRLKDAIHPSWSPLTEDLASYDQIYRRYVDGAIIRVGTCLIMWLFVLASLLVRLIQVKHFIGVTASIWITVHRWTKMHREFALALALERMKKSVARLTAFANRHSKDGQPTVEWYGHSRANVHAVTENVLRKMGIVPPFAIGWKATLQIMK